jgi:diguanylate cyclase
MSSVRSDALPTRDRPPAQRFRASWLQGHGGHGRVARIGAYRLSSGPSGAKARPDLTGAVIVVVDDDEDTLGYFALALRAQGATVMTASTAVEALRVVKQHRPDIVLSDIAMSGEDGYWLIREIRALEDDRLRGVPTVATTAYGRQHSEQRTLAAGFTAHLRKPVDPDVLYATIAGLIGRA